MQGNSRGNTWSRAHTTLDASDPRFWDFSWDDMAAYDLPAFVDAVLQHTGHSNLAFIGTNVLMPYASATIVVQSCFHAGASCTGRAYENFFDAPNVS